MWRCLDNRRKLNVALGIAVVLTIVLLLTSASILLIRAYAVDVREANHQALGNALKRHEKTATDSPRGTDDPDHTRRMPATAGGQSPGDVAARHDSDHRPATGSDALAEQNREQARLDGLFLFLWLLIACLVIYAALAPAQGEVARPEDASGQTTAGRVASEHRTTDTKIEK